VATAPHDLAFGVILDTFAAIAEPIVCGWYCDSIAGTVPKANEVASFLPCLQFPQRVDIP
jgi:hypothetical protein